MAFSYLSLFAWSFLSATILPLGVEPYFIYMLQQSNPVFWTVIIASAGNALGGITLLGMGMAGNAWLTRRVQNENKITIEKICRQIRRYGNPVLLLSWVPFLGDLLVMIVGLSKPRWTTAIIYLVVGKTARFAILAVITTGF
jgi:membrane protein YqaA with SNARE-associated domain